LFQRLQTGRRKSLLSWSNKGMNKLQLILLNRWVKNRVFIKSKRRRIGKLRSSSGCHLRNHFCSNINAKLKITDVGIMKNNLLV
jgi:hypothetical protein